MATVELDLSDLQEVRLKALFQSFIDLLAAFPSPAWTATVRALAWGVADEIRRRRRGEAAGPISIDLADEPGLTSKERGLLIIVLEDVTGLYQKKRGKALAAKSSAASLRAIAMLLRALAEARALAQPADE